MRLARHPATRMVALAVCLVFSLPARGQDQVAPDTVFLYVPTIDTSRVYSLGEIMVDATQGTRTSSSLVQRVTLAQIEQTDAFAAADAFRLIPAAHIPTNSRGETLIYLRNAGERQVSLYFDGALLNVPWDNRFDVSLLPISIVNNFTVAKGVPSLLYGANTIGGVVNLVSRSLDRPGAVTEITSQMGFPERGRLYATHLQRKGSWSTIASAGIAGVRGLALPSGAELPFNQTGDRLRTNTGSLFGHGFARAERTFADGSRVGASVLHLSGEKEIAPEGHKDPSVSTVRFWRYPSWHDTIVLVNGRTRLGPSRVTSLQASIWTAWFGQTIAQYASSAYSDITNRQNDDDWTLGSRLVVDHVVGRGDLRVAVNALSARHDQRDVDLTTTQDVLRRFRQHTLSTGAEYEVDLGRLSALWGLNLDAVLAPETGDQLGRDPDLAMGWSGAATWRIVESIHLQALAGSRTRFPTMRELFDTGLGRFVLNLDLKPERSLVGELGIEASGETFGIEATAFATRTSHTIDQQVVVVDGKRRRIRVNLEGSRLYGFETLAAYKPGSRFSVDGHLTWTYGRAADEESGRYDRKLAEKPSVLGRVAVQHQIFRATGIMVETQLFGRAYSLNEDNVMEPLGAAALVNLRLRHLFRLPRSAASYAETFVRADNLTDAVYLPQIGLPAPGRTVQAGVKLAI